MEIWHVGCAVKFPYRPRPLWLVDSRHPGCVLRVFRSYLPLKICRCPRIEFRCLSVRIVRPVFYCLDFPLQSVSLHCSAQFKSPRCTMENIFAIVLYLYWSSVRVGVTRSSSSLKSVGPRSVVVISGEELTVLITRTHRGLGAATVVWLAGVGYPPTHSPFSLSVLRVWGFISR